MIEFQLGTSTVSGGAPYLIHHVERVSDLVETALDVQLSSSISTDDAAELGKSVFVKKFFIINLNWSFVGGFQCHKFSPFTVDVKADLFVKMLSGRVFSRVCAIIALNCQHNPGLIGKRTGPWDAHDPW